MVPQLTAGSVLHAAFDRIVDYAGLFPPTAGSMTDSLQRFASYRRSPEQWMLGRFVVGAGRLDELLEIARGIGDGPGADDRWPLSVVLSGDIGAAGDAVAAFVERPDAAAFRVEAVEVKVASADDVARVLAALPAGVEAYVEVPVAGPFAPFLAAIRSAGARAKLRTGGVTAAAFPAADAVIGFIADARDAGVSWKATAGLHHPVGGSYPLTYDDGAPRHPMYGFVNLTVAAALLHRDGDRMAARAALLDTDSAAIRVTADSIDWRDTRFESAELATLRRRGFTSFGSCSFREPVDELAGLAA